jgi:hypothetical protein
MKTNHESTFENNAPTTKKTWSNPELKVLNKDIVKGGGAYTIIEIEVGGIISIGRLPS